MRKFKIIMPMGLLLGACGSTVASIDRSMVNIRVRQLHNSLLQLDRGPQTLAIKQLREEITLAAL